MQNQYSLWKYILLFGLISLGLLFAAPNLYGEDPAVQISAKGILQITPAIVGQVKSTLDTEKFPFLSAAKIKNNLLIRFASTDEQLKARDAIK